MLLIFILFFSYLHAIDKFDVDLEKVVISTVAKHEPLFVSLGSKGASNSGAYQKLRAYPPETHS